MIRKLMQELVMLHSVKQLPTNGRSETAFLDRSQAKTKIILAFVSSRDQVPMEKASMYEISSIILARAWVKNRGLKVINEKLLY